MQYYKQFGQDHVHRMQLPDVRFFMFKNIIKLSAGIVHVADEYAAEERKRWVVHGMKDDIVLPVMH